MKRLILLIIILGLRIPQQTPYRVFSGVLSYHAFNLFIESDMVVLVSLKSELFPDILCDNYIQSGLQTNSCYLSSETSIRSFLELYASNIPFSVGNFADCSWYNICSGNPDIPQPRTLEPIQIPKGNRPV